MVVGRHELKKYSDNSSEPKATFRDG
jgi:hypothetical protein